MQRHLESCAECAGSLELQKAFRTRLRDLASSTPVPPELAEQVRMKLDREQRGFS